MEFSVKKDDLQFELSLVAESGHRVASAQGPASIIDYSFDDSPQFDLLLVPGGRGTRREVDNPVMLDFCKYRKGISEGVCI